MCSKPSDIDLITYNSNVSTGLYVGASSAVSSDYAEWYKDKSINGVLNVAFDVDDTPFSNTDMTAIASILFAKVGLVDTGPSPGYSTVNQVQTLIAAVYVLDQLKTRSGPNFNVLVHCASGGSRSVAVAALWMSQRLSIEPAAYQTRFETALNAVRASRNLSDNPYDPTKPDGSYNDGKPMASHFYMAQSIDQTMQLFPSSGTRASTGWLGSLTPVTIDQE